jgi:predicted MPP superfamily phosphohydrolase
MLRALIFFVVFFGVIFGLHYYVWTRIVRDTLSKRWRRVATLLLVVLGASLPASFFVGRIFRIRTGWLAWPAYIWLGFLAMAFISLVGLELVRQIALRRTTEPGRREFLARAFGTVAAASSAALSGVALQRGLRDPPLKEVEIKLARLPGAADGYTIVQLTDVHVGPTIGREFIERLVDRVNALEPDLIAITGDLVDGTVADLGQAVAPLGRLKSKHGTFFVTGNHEYYSGWLQWRDELRRLGITVLQNHRFAVGQIDIAGVDDHSARTADVGATLAGRDPARPVVLLAHQPRTVDEAVAHGVDLQLSGHTHAGQMWPWNFLVRLQQGFLAGLFDVGATKLYVSSGTGYWGPPMRLGTSSELTRIRLRAEKTG